MGKIVPSYIGPIVQCLIDHVYTVSIMHVLDIVHLPVKVIHVPVRIRNRELPCGVSLRW